MLLLKCLFEPQNSKLNSHTSIFDIQKSKVFFDYPEQDVLFLNVLTVVTPGRISDCVKVKWRPINKNTLELTAQTAADSLHLIFPKGQMQKINMLETYRLLCAL